MELTVAQFVMVVAGVVGIGLVLKFLKGVIKFGLLVALIGLVAYNARFIPV